MKIRFQCPACDAALATDPNDPARDIACPECGTRIWTPTAGIVPGMVIGGFRIEARLGGGGMGQVYRATQLALDRQAALKILPPYIAEDPGAAADFEREMRNLAKLDHPNVAMAYAAGEENGIRYLAMAYVDGEDLAERLTRTGPFAESEAIACALYVARALAHAWERHRLLHLDIKPANIMIDREGRVKLTDLGLSQVLLEEGGSEAAAHIVGTPNYMSPEQARGERPDAVHADIYGLGVTLHHLLGGRLPFADDDPRAVLRNVQTEPLARLDALRPDLTPSTVLLVAAMTAKDDQQRPATWMEVIRALESAAVEGGFAGDRPAAAPASTLPPDAGSSSARRRTARVRRELAVLLVLCAALLGVRLLPRSAVFEPPTAPESPPDPAARAAALAAEARAKAVEAAIAAAEIEPDPTAAIAALASQRQTIEEPDLRRRLDEVIRRMEAQRQAGIEAAMTSLREKAASLAAQGDREAAARRWETYAGPFAGETREARQTEAAALRAEARRIAESNRAAVEARVREAGERAITTVLAGAPAEAAADLRALAKEGLTEDLRTEVEELAAAISAAAEMPELILLSYRKHLGRETTVYFTDRREQLEILDAYGDHVEAVYHGPEGDEPRRFEFDDLSLREKVVRLGREERPDLDIMRALLAHGADRPDAAIRYLERADTPLARALLERVTGGEE